MERKRTTIGVLMAVIAGLAVSLALVVTTEQANTVARQEFARRQYLEAELARWRAVLAHRWWEMEAQPVATRADPKQASGIDVSLRRENEALRNRVRELEERLETLSRGGSAPSDSPSRAPEPRR